MIVIYASEIAGCFGRNRYNSQFDTIKKMVQRKKGELSKEEILISSLSEQDRAEITRDVGKSETSADVVRSSVHAEDKIKTDIAKKYSMDPQNVQLLVNHEQRLHYTEHGTKKEDSVRDQIEVEQSLNIQKDNQFRRRLLYENDQYKVYVGGKCDGVSMIDNEPTIVEIKNRIKRLFGCVPEYERVQLMAYMFIYDIRRGILVESYNQKKNQFKIDFDENEWNELVQTEIGGFLDIYKKIESGCE